MRWMDNARARDMLENAAWAQLFGQYEEAWKDLCTATRIYERGIENGIKEEERAQREGESPVGKGGAPPDTAV